MQLEELKLTKGVRSSCYIVLRLFVRSHSLVAGNVFPFFFYSPAMDITAGKHNSIRQNFLWSFEEARGFLASAVGLSLVRLHE